ncbi:MAG: hypothetical protein KF906_09500 [Actinobacteria bacterium]|nr:hypothetical protein [Actinomycetota bacterium]
MPPSRSIPPGRRRSLAALVVVAALASTSAACSSAGSTPSTGSTPTVETYLSIGDSYAQGYQPASDGESPPYTDGYAYLLPDLATAKGYDLELVNFGCGGATVTSLVDTDGCKVPARAPGGPVYDDESQLDAAIDYLHDHEGEVRLITVSIGGNDVTKCARGVADPVACVADAIGTIDQKLQTALADLREAAGPDTTIVGLTYPDVILGAYLDEGTRSLAELSVTAFEKLINPMLRRNYEAIGGIFVDVTDGTDGYVPLDRTTTLDPYGEIPVAVAEVCRLTWFCERKDIHPRSVGYERIAELIVAALPAR